MGWSSTVFGRTVRENAMRYIAFSIASIWAGVAACCFASPGPAPLFAMFGVIGTMCVVGFAQRR